MTRPIAVVAAAVAVTTACGSGGPEPDTAPAPPPSGGTAAAAAAAGCRPARPAPAGGTAQTLSFGGEDRAYLLALPAGYEPMTEYPLVLNFHGFGGSSETHEANTSMGRTGSARGYIVATPDSLGEPPQWNAFGAPGAADDFGFAQALVADLSRRLCVDSRRVYAAGHSNGSAFAAFLACRPPHIFAAVAMVSATTPAGCPDGVAPAVIAIHGAADPTVPYAGGTVGGSTVQVPAAPDVIAGYAERYGCGAKPARDEPTAGVEQIRYSGCTSGAEVVLDTVAGGTHHWPGGVAAQADPDEPAAGKEFAATDAILDFFDSHRAPRG